MKTKIFKIVLPAFAIVMAVSLAFATEESNLPYTGYIDSLSGPVQIQTDCPNTGTVFCYESGQQVFNDIELSDPKLDRE
ncbi:DUF6520 family protein [Allomuricauda taeanensis]|uniref:DUF6520 family protein n=1 Tax=Flagellimonas taeanensis TaxID=1005926 RepID=UPI002E7C3D78|nr:DUF6520 family protein [Allomuricauda taeanensis]MEE1963961.1 DUF6520 family protein [Allomuricauda taeanensis]